MNMVRTSARNAAREIYCVALQGRSYFDRSLRQDDSLEWLLMLTMPNSGSTSFGKILMTAKAAVSLTDRCEGEWLIPSMSNLRTRWDDDYEPSMTRVRARWLWRLRKSAGSPRLVIEKSPPNMVRIDQLRAALHPMKTYTVILVRDPYAVCEGWHRRYGKEGLARTSMPKLAGVDNDLDYFRLLGEYWVHRGRYLANQRANALSVVRYEDLVTNPAAIIAELAAQIPLLSDVEPGASVAVKDYELQILRDMNEQQIAALSTDQIDAISSGLEQGMDTVTSLGYTLR